MRPVASVGFSRMFGIETLSSRTSHSRLRVSHRSWVARELSVLHSEAFCLLLFTGLLHHIHAGCPNSGRLDQCSGRHVGPTEKGGMFTGGLYFWFPMAVGVMKKESLGLTLN
uniref:(northern house mosquito) hypothetical protein n=1 Tax=Culex pipiens TaxID=7175 RepID=A0A8D8FRI2_CULPI